MTKEVAIARLSRMVASDTDPQLTALDLEYLLHEARTCDSVGRSWNDVDWEPTYNLNKAASKGWEEKAAKASSRFNFSSDVNSFQRRQVFEHCIAMADRYKKRIMQSIEVSYGSYIYDPVIGNLGG